MDDTKDSNDSGQEEAPVQDASFPSEASISEYLRKNPELMKNISAVSRHTDALEKLGIGKGLANLPEGLADSFMTSASSKAAKDFAKLGISSRLGKAIEDLRRSNLTASDLLREHSSKLDRKQIGTQLPDMLKPPYNPVPDLLREQKDTLILVLEALKESAEADAKAEAKEDARDARNQKQWRFTRHMLIASVVVPALLSLAAIAVTIYLSSR